MRGNQSYSHACEGIDHFSNFHDVSEDYNIDDEGVDQEFNLKGDEDEKDIDIDDIDIDDIN